MSDLVKFDEVESKIIELRNQKVILDSDVANLYGVTTKEINQAARNNPEKFPDGYIFSLTKEEKAEVVKNFDHLEKLKFFSSTAKSFYRKRFIYAGHYSERQYSYANNVCNNINIFAVKTLLQKH